MKPIKHILALLIIGGLTVVSSCSKKRAVTPVNTTSNNFYYGNILGSPNTIIGPGNAILLRTNGTCREYANDYYSLGTTMTAADTASAKIKLDGTYTTVLNGSIETVTATWIQPNGSPVLTYTLVGTINGNDMTGTFSSAGNGIGSSTQFKFTNKPQM